VSAVRRAAVALGSNLGDRLGALQGAVDDLAGLPGVRVVAVSPVFETDPVGGPEQGRYLNAVVALDTTRTAADLLAAAHRIEARHGRTRQVRWGARTLDVDLLAVGTQTSDDPALALPHPRAAERAFVLVPWAAVDPGFVVAGLGPVAALAAAVGRTGVHPRPDLGLVVGSR